MAYKTEKGLTKMYLGEINNQFGYATLRSEEEFEKFTKMKKLAENNHPTQLKIDLIAHKGLPLLYQNITKKPKIKSNAEISFPNRYNKKSLTIEEYLNNNEYTKASFKGRKYEDFLIKNNIMIPSIRERMVLSKSKYSREKEEFFKFHINSMNIQNLSPNNKLIKCPTSKSTGKKKMRVMKVVYSSRK